MRSKGVSFAILATLTTAVFVGLVVFVANGVATGDFLPHAASAQTAPGAPAALTVDAADLTRAGFTAPAAIAAAPGRYAPPNYYFHVKESIAAAHPDAEAPDVVAVLIFHYTYATSVPMDNAVVTDLSGKTQACLTRPGYYLCVTGPDHDKTVALLNILKLK